MNLESLFAIFLCTAPNWRQNRASAWPRGQPNGDLTLTLTLGVNPHRTLETLADKMLAGWHTNVRR